MLNILLCKFVHFNKEVVQCTLYSTIQVHTVVQQLYKVEQFFKKVCTILCTVLDEHLNSTGRGEGYRDIPDLSDGEARSQFPIDPSIYIIYIYNFPTSFNSLLHY